MREKYKRDGLFKQQILFVIPEIHNELSAGIEYCAVKALLLTYTIFFYFTAFQANGPCHPADDPFATRSGRPCSTIPDYHP